MLCLICFTNTVKCQNKEPLTKIQRDSISIESTKRNVIVEDTVSIQKGSFLNHLSLLLDYGKILALATDFESKNELGVELEFSNKFFLSTEFGRGEISPNDAYTNTNYKSKGNYFRFGFGYNGTLTDKSNMGLSVKYAESKFSDGGTIKIESTSGIFNSTADSFERTNLTAKWFEIVLHSESLIRTNLYAGFKFSIRRMFKYDNQFPIDVYTIPGYGRTFDKSTPALNLYIKYRFKF
jgi:hypothetical protein